MKHSARAQLLTTAAGMKHSDRGCPQGISVPRGPLGTSMIHVTLSSPVPPPAGTVPVWPALQNDLGDKPGPNAIKTVGKGTETGDPALAKLSTACSHGQAEYRGNCYWLCYTLAVPVPTSLLRLMLPQPCCCTHTFPCTHSKLPALHFAAATSEY